MGSSLDEIRDDENHYRELCYKYGERCRGREGVYSIHHKWLIERHENSSDISFKDYERKCDIERLESQIKSAESNLASLKAQLEKLKGDL